MGDGGPKQAISGAHPEIGWFLKQQIFSIFLATFFFPASQLASWWIPKNQIHTVLQSNRTMEHPQSSLESK
jgi:hypothetical protein